MTQPLVYITQGIDRLTEGKKMILKLAGALGASAVVIGLAFGSAKKCD